jgi:hypothetical protein
MAILLHEMKKIFDWKKVLILIGICLIIFQLYIKFYFVHFPNGTDKYSYDITAQMIKDYGNEMDEAEFDHFIGLYEQKLRAANQYIQSDAQFIDAGITSFQQFITDTQSGKLVNYAFEQRQDMFHDLYARKDLVEDYENYEKRIFVVQPVPSQEARIQEVKDNSRVTSIFSYQVMEHYTKIISYTAIMILLSLMLMLTPIYISDRRKKLHILQYTSKIGRSLFKRKLAASLISAFLIITVELGVIFAFYSTNNTQMFFASRINSVFNNLISWYDLTFFQYILLTVAAIYALGLFITLIVAFLSSLVVNYTTLIGLQVPIAYALLGLGLNLLLEQMTNVRFLQLVEPLCYIGLLGAGVLTIYVKWRKEKVLDIT